MISESEGNPACSPQEAIGLLCGACGLCCNGALFASVQLQEQDNAARLEALGLGLRREKGASWVRLPCAAHDGCSCRIYAERPARCRTFECKLLQEVILGRRSVAAALRIIERTKKHANEVRALLRQRGQTDESISLSRRYQQFTEHGSEGAGVRPEHDGELAFAVFQLTQLLQLSFYTHREG